jgi:diaminohydroxyphosphoribosylaminopyrimidine deaminase / 5-amino-6-(5-phosphoribosylamino)uracil reductase
MTRCSRQSAFLTPQFPAKRLTCPGRSMNLIDPTARPPEDAHWRDALAAIRAGRPNGASYWDGIFGPLRAGQVDDLLVVGQVGQSLDGRAATSTGHSHYINGAEGLDHLHRLRALMDAVVVGVGTALVDDPLLTVRRVAGPHPARVVIDPNARLPAAARAFRDDGVRRLVITAEGGSAPAGIEHVALPSAQGRLDPCDILTSLAARGLRRILIEGGPATVARFLEARCLDRLHVVVAPIILGGGRSSLDLAPITRCEEALRPQTVTHVLGNEVLFDCDLSAQRRPVGIAKKST